MTFTPQTTPMIIRSLAIAAALAVATPALAQNVASFVVANDDGYGVDTCLQSGSDCGQPVATAWCVANGYVRSVGFRAQTAADITGSLDAPTQVAAVDPAGVVITCER
ncbi:MAG: hypothetical protein ABWZ57_09935 [Mesorhizobium sp.]